MIPRRLKRCVVSRFPRDIDESRIEQRGDNPARYATCVRIIGLDPAKEPYLSIGSVFLGSVSEGCVEQRSESPNRYRTQFAVIQPIRKMRA